jgi:hypothetical protein
MANPTSHRNFAPQHSRKMAAPRICNTFAMGNIRGLDTPYEMLKALKKRLAPTDRAKRLELARTYQALRKAPKAQSLDSWLLLWETTYSKAEDSKHTKTPLPSDVALTAELGEQATAQQILAYQQRVKSLNFAAVISHPNIAYAVSKLAQFLKNPSAAHIAAADRVVRYLYGTRTLAIEYSGRNDSQIFNCASDAAFADDTATRRSSEGYLFQLYGGPIDWRAGKQKTVTTSSTEAELLSLSTASREIIWWRRFFESIRFDTQQHTKIHCDNIQTIRILTKEAMKLDSKLRHVDIHRHWLRQEVQNGKIAIQWLPTADTPADGLTKPLSTQKHAAFVEQLNLVDISSHLVTEQPQAQAPQHTEPEHKDIDTLRYAYSGDI